jgi:DNA-binding XRE family transcriptional regulator
MAKNKQFRKLLKERKVKRKALAERLGVSVRTVEYWISGRNRPSIINIIAMAKMFNMTIESMYAIFKT